MNKTKEKICDFISRRFPQDCHWTDGNCYYFAAILKARFKQGEICYDQVEGHFLFYYKGDYYDYTGLKKYSKEYATKYIWLWEWLQIYDGLLAARIIRDCIE